MAEFLHVDLVNEVGTNNSCVCASHINTRQLYIHVSYSIHTAWQLLFGREMYPQLSPLPPITRSVKGVAVASKIHFMIDTMTT